ncbi:MAG: biotin/lipoyl-binding protein [Oscillospiraceae bacterium]|nr:biotin/lipoyl-binding protein [Oscillospiraceae bacterium]
MKRFNITVNGKAYDVAVEEIGGGAPVAPAPAAPAAPAPTAAPAPAPAPAAAPANVEGTKVTAPMPGTILDIKVKVGDEVSEGQVLLILEAMKMENDIPATATGKVAAINVNKGDTVNSNDVLVVIQ